MIINNDEINWLTNNYPGLAIDSLSEFSVVIRGDFKFKAEYNEADGKYYIVNNNKANKHGYHVIEDSYRIEIFSHLDLSEFPRVKNIDGRLLNLANKLGKDSKDLHVYSGPLPEANTLCVVGPIDAEKIKGNIPLHELLNDILLPFFYDSSHYERYNYRPREDYSHGVWGVLENYYDLPEHDIDTDKDCIDKLKKDKFLWPLIKKRIISKNNPKGHHYCIKCFTDKNNYGLISKTRKCHNKIFRGLFKLHERIRLLNLYSHVEDYSFAISRSDFILNELRKSYQKYQPLFNQKTASLIQSNLDKVSLQGILPIHNQKH